MENLQNGEALDKGAYEFQWAQQLARKTLTLDQYKTWQGCRSVDRIPANIGSVFSHWGWHNGRSLIFSEFRLAQVTVNVAGVTYHLTDRAGKTYKVSHTPVPLSGTGVFVWVPHFNEFRHVPENWEDADEPGYLRVSMCVWQSGNPHKVQKENHTYLTTKRTFERLWAYATISKS